MRYHTCAIVMGQMGICWEGKHKGPPRFPWASEGGAGGKKCVGVYS